MSCITAKRAQKGNEGREKKMQKCTKVIDFGRKKGESCTNLATMTGGRCENHVEAQVNEEEDKDEKKRTIFAAILKKAAAQAASEEDNTEDGEEKKKPVVVVVVAAAPVLLVAGVYSNRGVGAKRCVGVIDVYNHTYMSGVIGSSKDTGAWKPFWIKHTKMAYPTVCRVKDCEKKVAATGHMYWRDDPEGHKYNYLVPICSHHNSSKYDKVAVPLKKGHAVKILQHPSV